MNGRSLTAFVDVAGKQPEECHEGPFLFVRKPEANATLPAVRGFSSGTGMYRSRPGGITMAAAASCGEGSGRAS